MVSILLLNKNWDNSKIGVRKSRVSVQAKFILIGASVGHIKQLFLSDFSIEESDGEEEPPRKRKKEIIITEVDDGQEDDEKIVLNDDDDDEEEDEEDEEDEVQEVIDDSDNESNSVHILNNKYKKKM